MASNKKTVRIKITAGSAHGRGGVFYRPSKESEGGNLMLGEVHAIDEDFAKMLIHQKRAVLADDEVLPSDRPLTTDALTRDPEVESRDPKRVRAR